ncbi:MAG TPA: FGGY family carbohydrate kinase [Limnochordia bacterium]
MAHLRRTPAAVAVDVGSTTCKAAVIDLAGGVLGLARREVAPSYPRPGWAEIDPERWWEAAADVLRRAAAQASARGGWEPLGLAVTGQMHAPVLLDERGQAVCPAQLWLDQRSAEEAARLWSEAAEPLRRAMGRPLGTSHTAPKLRWLAVHHPEALSRARWLLLPKDFVRYRLTGEAATDASDAGGTGMFASDAAEWRAELVHACGVRSEIMPPILPATAVAGRLTPAAAAATGLPSGLPVMVGASDTRTTLLGSGVPEIAPICLYLGTAAWIAWVKRGAVAPAGQGAADPVRTYVTIERWAATGTAGGAFHWVSGLFGERAGRGEDRFREDAAAGPAPEPPESDYAALEAMAAAVPAGSDGVCFVPHLMGTRGRQPNPRARAAWAGLTLAHGPGHLVRACLEGVAFAVRSLCEQNGLAADAPALPAVVVGGGARGRLWRQILATALARPLWTTRVPEAGLVGAAAIAAVGVGACPDLATAVSRLVHAAERIEPVGDWLAASEEAYSRYQRLERALTPLGADAAAAPAAGAQDPRGARAG